jgi:carboxylesterase type B
VTPVLPDIRISHSMLVSVHAHLLAGVDVFQQAICQSGVLRTLGPLKVNDPYMEHRYRSLFATLDKSLSQSVESLRTVPVEAIVELTAKQSGGALAAFFVTDDTDCEDSFFPKSTDWVTPYAFCKRLMIGDCAAESMILGPIMGQIPSKDIVRLLTSSRALPSTFLPQFGLSSSDLGDFDHHTQVGMKALTDFQNEITFHGPIEAVIAAAPGISTYVYRFDRENAWPGSLLAGIAHHTIELLYLAGVPLECPTAEAEKDRELSQLLMKHWTDFATRKEPWRGAGKERWEMLYERNGDAREVKRNPGETRNLKLVGEELSENADTMLRISVGLSGGTIL